MTPLCHYLSVNRTDRLYALREELRRAGAAGRSAERLAVQFEVSVRTVKRDISALQQGGFPVWARPGPGGGYVVDAAATLPPVTFTDAEVSGLAAAVEAHRGQPFDAHARAALVKVMGVLGAADQERVRRLTDRIWIDQTSTPSSAAVRRSVEQALHERRALVVEDADGVSTLVDPVFLAHTADAWFLVAQDRERGETTWLPLEQLRSARLTGRAALEVPVSSVGAAPTTATPVGLDP